MSEVAIVGLGVTEMGKVYGRTVEDFAAESLSLALADAGLDKSDIDGLLVNRNHSDLGPKLQMTLGLENLTQVSQMDAQGSTAGAMIQFAAASIRSGNAKTIALIYADAPLKPAIRSGESYSGKIAPAPGMEGLLAAHGVYGAAAKYALAARRHMSLFGTNEDHFGAVAVAQRKWAQMNPMAQMRSAMTLEDHHNSRWICEPLRLLDCCLVSNGAVCVIMTSKQRAVNLRQLPVYVRGVAQGSPGDSERADRDPAIFTGATKSGEIALRQAKITLADIDVVELYDCFTYTVIVTLEDYGFCAKGDGGPFVADGKLGPGGSLPTNTGGGQLSAYYMWGFTPLSEGIIQSRGQGGERQIEKHDHVLVSGNGGILNFHSTTILSHIPA